MSTFVCIGTGPSLDDEELVYLLHHVGDALVIAVNNAWERAPWADYLYACDAKWWDYYKGAPAFSGTRMMPYSIEDAALQAATEAVLDDYPSITPVPAKAGFGLGDEVIHFGPGSGYQAIGLAVLLGATRIILLGYDMSTPDNRTHFFGDYPEELRTAVHYATWPYTQLAEELRTRGIEVINCTMRSMLLEFPIRDLRSVI